MCLTVDEKKTQRMKKKMRGWITVWKVYRVGNPLCFTEEEKKQVCPPIRRGLTLRPGRITSNRPTAQYPYKRSDTHFRCPDDTYDSDGDLEINSGIHVCLTRKSARKYIKTMKENHQTHLKIFRCRAHMVNFVAFGKSYYLKYHYNTAVFHSIMIDEKAWEQALNGDFR